MKLALLTAAAVASFYSFAALVTGFDRDYAVAVLLAILCLGCVVGLQHRDYVRARERELAEYRRRVWARRDAEAYRRYEAGL